MPPAAKSGSMSALAVGFHARSTPSVPRTSLPPISIDPVMFTIRYLKSCKVLFLMDVLRFPSQICALGLFIRRIRSSQRRTLFNTALDEVFHVLLLGGIDCDLFREM